LVARPDVALQVRQCRRARECQTVYHGSRLLCFGGSGGTRRREPIGGKRSGRRVGEGEGKRRRGWIWPRPTRSSAAAPLRFEWSRPRRIWS